MLIYSKRINYVAQGAFRFSLNQYLLLIFTQLAASPKIILVFFFQAGISSGYQEKPCLNPLDPECPDSAPNKNSKQVCVCVREREK